MCERKDGLYWKRHALLTVVHYVQYFTSATTSEMAIALARIVEEDGKSVVGSRGLSAFFVRMRKDDGEYNHLKGKHGYS